MTLLVGVTPSVGLAPIMGMLMSYHALNTAASGDAVQGAYRPPAAPSRPRTGAPPGAPAERGTCLAPQGSRSDPIKLRPGSFSLAAPTPPWPRKPYRAAERARLRVCLAPASCR